MTSKYARERLSWNGWGWVDERFELGGREEALLSFLRQALGMKTLRETPPMALEEIPLPPTRLGDDALEALREALAPERVETSRRERLFHAVGKSYWDVLRMRRGELDGTPDAVVYPEDADEVMAVMALASEHDWAIVPFGGGSSVVGGVEAVAEGAAAVITLDTMLLAGMRELDEEAHTATFGAGTYGPDLEEALQARGYTLGHYPQSFEFSTLGGWIAARGSGQQSNRYGGASKWLVAADVVTPSGIWRTPRHPSSSTGPDLNAIIAGSEGTLGVITEATVSIHPVPETRDYRAFLFKDFERGLEAARELVQADVPTAMIRLSDGDETKFFGAFRQVGKDVPASQVIARDLLSLGGFEEGGQCMMLLGLEGAREEVLLSRARAPAICLSKGAIPLGAGPGDSWYEGRFDMPYVRRMLMDRGFGVDTLESATTWSNALELREKVNAALSEALEDGERRGIVLCHLSHCYPTGTSLYWTYVFARDEEDELEQWRRIKRVASEAVVANGGTISHHHGVGTDHLPYLEAEKGQVGLTLLRGLKQSVDPKGVMNPGKLIP